jgi:hypothetical protein
MTHLNFEKLKFDDIYAGLAGVKPDFDEMELGKGVVLRCTYAHLMAPFLMAFAPAERGKPHPGPWKAALGGIDFDLGAELFIPERLGTTLTNRIDVARTIVALMRMWAVPSITLPVISNVSFSAATKVPDSEVLFLPLEIEPRYFPIEVCEGSALTIKRLQWVKEHWEQALELVGTNEEFHLAVDALDRGQFIQNPSLTLVSLWGALEALFSPAKVELRFRISALIASYLKEPGEQRMKLHKQVMKLYDERSAAAHGQLRKDPVVLLQTFDLLRSVLVMMIEEAHVPSKDELEARLFGSSSTIA